MDAEQILVHLNSQQQLAVQTVQGPVLVLAGPGSGKTRVITHRIAYLIEQIGVSPWNILAVTFTNKAAKEMRSRLEALIGQQDAHAMTIGTFHALCARILRAESLSLLPFGINSSFVIYDTDEQLSLLKECIRGLDMDEKQYKPATLQALISRAKNDLLTADELAERAEKYIETVAARVYKQYQKRLQTNNAVDFDDLIMLTERLLQTDTTVLQKYNRRYQYIHVDEFQDCNASQYKLIRLLAYGTKESPADSTNICVVGDDDQMIYTWRGANIYTMQQFEHDFPATKVILLEQNYRSTQYILDAAQGLVQTNRARKQKNLWTDQGSGEKVLFFEAYDEADEAYLVVREIERLLASKTVASLADIAVMYRTNAQSRALEEQCLHANVPYKVIGSRKFYERREIRDILAYMRVLANHNDSISLQRILNVPNRKIGTKTLASLQIWANEKQISLYEAILHFEENSLLGSAAKKSLRTFYQLLLELLHNSQICTLPALMDAITAKSGYEADIQKEIDGAERWANILELRRVANDYTDIDPVQALPLFLENVALVGGADTAQSSGEGVSLSDSNVQAITLITLHAAKGLEYPIVFITGMDEGSLPHARSLNTLDDIEEERRLAYVGFTRAMQRLYLVRARRRSFFGETHITDPSRFLEDIPEYAIVGYCPVKYPVSSPLLPSQSRMTTSSVRTVPLPSRVLTDASPPPRFTPQERVRHNLFGNGIILRIYEEQGTYFAEIQFEEFGTKRLNLDYAKVQKV